jgi:hypothetical protein
MKRWAGEKYDLYKQRIREDANKVKEHLQGKVLVEGSGGRPKGRYNPHQSKPRTVTLLREYRKHRDRRKKLAYLSKRKNRI